jgi:FtsP/CotA-like multicopper oxidase with cupredoxin domain
LRNSAVLAAGLAIPQTNARKTEIARPLLLTWFPHFVGTLPIPQVIKPTGRVRFIGPTVAPFANELGWKDTVQVPPCTVTRIITEFGGYAGRYVWHCHLLEHEDNEMMRPYGIVSA